MTSGPDVSTSPTPHQSHDLGSDAEARFARLFGHGFVAGNSVVRLKNGDAIFEAMLDAIANAEREVNFTTFIYGKGDVAEAFADAFAERARAGVTVRVLLDAAGRWSMEARLDQQMRDAGVHVKSFRPMRPWHLRRSLKRTHRKVLVVDNRVAFTGGVGIAWPWQGAARNPDEWRDSQFRFEGPVVVGLESAFWSNWLEVEQLPLRAISARPIPDAAGNAACLCLGPKAAEGWSDAASLLWGLCETAQRRLTISTPYFAPPMASLQAIERAADRGVEVDILIPGPHADKHVSNWVAADAQERLIGRGVRLWEYAPTMLHLKQVLVDDDLSCVGSVNVNARSTRRDDEVAVIVKDAALAATLASDFAQDLAAAEQVSATTIARRRVWRRPLGAALRVLRHDV